MLLEFIGIYVMMDTVFFSKKGRPITYTFSRRLNLHIKVEVEVEEEVLAVEVEVEVEIEEVLAVEVVI